MNENQAITILEGMIVCGKANITVTIGEKGVEAMNMAIKALEKIAMLERLTDTYAQKGHAPTRTISMEELKELIK